MLVDRADVRAWLQIGEALSQTNAALLDLAHPLAEAVFKQWMQEKLEYQQVVEYLPSGEQFPYSQDDLLAEPELRGTVVQFVASGPGSETLQLTHTPVWTTSIEVREDVGGYAGQSGSAFGSSTVLTQGTDYYLDIDDATNNLSTTGLLWRIGLWPTEARSVKVTYYGGRTAAQLAGEWGNLKMAALLTIEAAYRGAIQRNVGGLLTSESIGKYSKSMDTRAFNDIVGGGFGVPMKAQQIAFSSRSMGGVFG